MNKLGNLLWHLFSKGDSPHGHAMIAVLNSRHAVHFALRVVSVQSDYVA